jgi:hypothetical protein
VWRSSLSDAFCLVASVLVYCYSKKETVELCSALSSLGISCEFYNSDVKPEHKTRVHHRWVKGQIKVMVATNGEFLRVLTAQSMCLHSCELTTSIAWCCSLSFRPRYQQTRCAFCAPSNDPSRCRNLLSVSDSLKLRVVSCDQVSALTLASLYFRVLLCREAGRAGRDGVKSCCCLWYSPRDLPRQSTRVYAKQNMTDHLYPLVAYCHQIHECRR